MKLALVQQNLVVGAFERNAESLLAAIDRAAEGGADAAVCSELAITGYPPRDLLERRSFVDDNLRQLEAFAKRAAIPAVVGFVDRPESSRGAPLYNAAAVTGGGRVRSVHHKCLLPTYDVFDEARYFSPGGSVALAELHGVPVGVSICEDMWSTVEVGDRASSVPAPRYDRDPVAELAALGPRAMINISASPFAVQKRALRPDLVASQSRRHRLPFAMVNQVGGNDDLIFDGTSAVASADGSLGARAHELDEDAVIVEIDPDSGRASGPIRDRPEPDADGDVTAASRALALGTRDYVETCGFERVLVGLSGGIDSAVTAALAVEALGPERVWGVAMPSRYSSAHSLDDARALADSLGIRFDVLSIDEPFAAFETALAPMFAGREPDVAEENLQARTRGVYLMALSNKFGPLVLTTGNKSELAVGYCTLYGDMAGGLSVISDVPKTQVYAIARDLNARAGGERIPASIIDKAPSAELRPGQLDQDSLPPYETLDAILELLVEEQCTTAEVAARGFDRALVDRVFRLVRANEYKRQQAPLGLKIRARAFGHGRRMPLAGSWRG